MVNDDFWDELMTNDAKCYAYESRLATLEIVCHVVQSNQRWFSYEENLSYASMHECFNEAELTDYEVNNIMKMRKFQNYVRLTFSSKRTHTHRLIMIKIVRASAI